ncbi:hypothetical protein K523DRAFT_296311 [Schizophyllum commune Tattone D]|nr:hypothetical protein K523DRAFT_296311 [Schizophyllum commune Tattone D]
MPNLRRSPSLESVSSVRSLESMQSIDSVKSFGNAHSPGGVSVKSSDYGVLNDMDMGRTITSAPVIPAVVDGDVEKSSSMDDGPPNTCDDEREPAPKSTVEPAPLGYRKHDRFYMDSRTIKLVLDDGTLYRVFRQSFAANSTLFAEEYLSGHGDDEDIKLPGVSSVDLDRFLSLMYPSELATCELSSAQDWISVLRLAHRWSFPTLRARALREIELVGNAVDKIATAREFSDLETSKQWLMPAFVEACATRSWLGSISVQDAERLGAGTILAVARIREEMREVGGRKYDIESAIAGAGLAAAHQETRGDITVMATAPNSLDAHPTLVENMTARDPYAGNEVPADVADPATSRGSAADEALKAHQGLFGGWACTFGGNRTIGVRDTGEDSVKDAPSKSDSVRSPVSFSVSTALGMQPQGSAADPIRGSATTSPPADSQESVEDDKTLPSLKRAMFAWGIAQPTEGELPEVLHSRRARALRIANEILNSSALSNNLENQECVCSMTPDGALRLVRQRMACLISRKLLSAHAPNVDGQNVPSAVRVCVPTGVSRNPYRHKILTEMKGHGLTISDDANNGRILLVHVPRMHTA